MLSPGGTTAAAMEVEPEQQPEAEESTSKRARSAEETTAAADEEMEEVVIKPPEDPELPVNFTACYELCAILTHKGPSAEGGHYVAFAKQKGDTWCCFDDDKVTECRGSELPRKLDGGTAHNHMAYMLLYRTKDTL